MTPFDKIALHLILRFLRSILYMFAATFYILAKTFHRIAAGNDHGQQHHENKIN